MTDRIGGVVFRVYGTDTLSFLPSATLAGSLFGPPPAIAKKVTAIPEMAHIPGAPMELRGVALVDGDMIPIIEVVADPGPSAGPADREKPTGAMLVCTVLGECVGLIGIDVLATGFFDIDKQQTGDAEQQPQPPRPPRRIAVQVPSPMAGAPPLIAPTFDVAGVIARVREGRWAV
jgi:hypothetical protein